MIKKLFSIIEEEKVNSDVKKWVANVLGGAIISDGVLHPNEVPHLEKLFNQLKQEPGMLLIIKDMMQKKTPPAVSPINLPENLANYILKCVLEICAVDHEICSEEIRFINEVGMALGFDILKTHKMLNFALRRVKIDFFQELLQDLHEEERRWLAIVTLKQIYADGVVDTKEVPYLNDIYELANGDRDKIKLFKKEAKQFELSELPTVYFDQHLSQRILKYLVEIAMTDADIDQREMDLIYKIAQILNFEDDELEALIDEIETVRFFMQASNELVN